MLGVYAIPNEKELKDDLTWSSRRAFHIYIYIRTEEKFLRKDHTPTKLFNNSRKFITGKIDHLIYFIIMIIKNKSFYI